MARLDKLTEHHLLAGFEVMLSTDPSEVVAHLRDSSSPTSSSPISSLRIRLTSPRSSSSKRHVRRVLQYTQPACSPKLIPWFVSDVTPSDFRSTIPSLLSEKFFPAADVDSATHEHLRQMVTRWQSYLASGVFSLSVPQETPLGASNEKVSYRLAVPSSRR